MTFEAEYDTEDAIPAEVRHLFTESGETFTLIGAADMKTPKDVATVQEALRKERADHKAVRDKLAKYGEIEPEEAHALHDRKAELEAGGDKPGDEKTEAQIEARIKSATGPLQRKLDAIEQEKEALAGEVQSYRETERTTKIRESVREQAKKAGVHEDSLDDVIFRATHGILEVTDEGEIQTRDGVGVTPGVGIDVWLSEAREKNRRWWPESQGGGSRGGDGAAGGTNPWKEGSENMTEQGRILRTDRAKAEQMARAAGKTITGEPLAT